MHWPNRYCGTGQMLMERAKWSLCLEDCIEIEMSAFRTIGEWLEDSGWTSALVEADITSPGTADSFLKASHLTRMFIRLQLAVCTSS